MVDRVGFYGRHQGNTDSPDVRDRVKSDDQPVTISRFTSFFLDFLRAAAALGVVAAHLTITHLAPSAALFEKWGHLMVLIFFVLSGFLIAASVEGKAIDARRYTALRLGRLWSVLIPCLLITLALQLTVGAINPQHASAFQRGHLALRFTLPVFFLNEMWFTSSAPPFNSPLWSLAYEAWYYAFFGVCIFVRSPVRRTIILIAMAAVIGPKVLALFPAWLTGVALLKLFHRRQQLRPWAWPIFIGALALAAIWFVLNPQWPQSIGHQPMFFSAAFLADYVFGLAVAGVILGVELLWGQRTPAAWIDLPVRKAAAVSFTLYLIHFPLMVSFGAILPYDPTNPWQVGAIVAVILIIALVLGSWIEPQRRTWTAQVSRLFTLGGKKSPATLSTAAVYRASEKP
jgi:peptidoglycan/LPS O-acetylase OafA/YrhL